MFFYPMLPDYRKIIFFWKVPKLRLFVLLVKATCRCRCVWSTGGSVLTWELKYSEKNLINSHFVHHETYKYMGRVRI